MKIIYTQEFYDIRLMNVLARNDQEYAFKAENMISRTKDTLDFIPRFLAMTELEQVSLYFIRLDENIFNIW